MALYGSPATVACDPTGIAAIGQISAVPGPGGVELKFFTLWEAYTASFEVQRVDELSGATLYSVGTPTWLPDMNRKRYSITDPNGIAGSVYRLIEHQQDGRGDLFTGPVVAEVPPPAGAWASNYNADSLAAVVASYATPEPDSPLSPQLCSGTQPSYLILCPDSFASALVPYASLWSARGVTTGIRKSSVADSCFGGYKGYIRFATANGTAHFLLVGDANDRVMWDDSTRWVNGWTYPRIYTFVGGEKVWLAHIPSQPEKDIIPTFYTAVTDSPHVSWTWSTPYYATDLPYSDIDGDSLPDVVVGRLPASSVADINAYTAKLATWFDIVRGTFTSRAALLTWAVNQAFIPAWPTAFAADSLRAAFASPLNFTEVSITPYSTLPFTLAVRESLKQVVNAAASGNSDLITWNLNWTDRYTYSGFWTVSKFDSRDLPIRTNARPFVSLALSCEMNNFDMTEDYELYGFPLGPFVFTNPVRPIAEVLLFNPGKGAIAQVGPTRGSHLKGNALFGRELLERIYEPGSNLGSSFLQAQRNAMLQFPAYRDLFKSYVLLGDPRLGPLPIITGVATPPPVERTRLLRPEPNPFNPLTRLRFFLAHSTNVSIDVYDVHGRLVRKLVRSERRPVGWGEVSWNGRTERGTRAGSGIYFIQMRAGVAIEVQRAVMLK